MYCLHVTQPQIANVEAVRKILLAYFSTLSFEIETRRGVAYLVGEPWEDGPAEVNDYHWPQGAKETRYGQDPKVDMDTDAARVLATHGDADFLTLLKKLGPHLKSPLIIHALRYADETDPNEPTRAAVWCVLPGSTKVEFNQFTSS